VTYDCLLVNGDSYSASYQNFKVWPEYLASALNVELFNKSVMGSSNDRILRSSIEYTNQLLENNRRPLVVVAWSFIDRIETWYNGSDEEIVAQAPDQWSSLYEEQIRLVTVDWLDYVPDYVKYHTVSDGFYDKAMVDFYLDNYLFSEFLDKHQLQYRFFSAAKNTHDPAESIGLRGLNIIKKVTNNNCINNLHEFSIQQWAFQNDPFHKPVSGHLSESGHKQFADVIKDKLTL
jgi:hypothetical protein